MFLLDTDTIIYSLKGNDVVRRNLALHVEDPLAISAITLMELYYGAYKSQRVTGNIAKIKKLEQTFDIIPVEIESVEIFGRLKAELEQTGTPLDDFDLAIAACALSYNLILVTNNLKHFRRIEGLRLANWAESDANP